MVTVRRIRRFYDKNGKLTDEVEEVTTFEPKPMKIKESDDGKWTHL